ncbi:hypothetical protein GN956_G2715 [Arapaima gigas]
MLGHAVSPSARLNIGDPPPDPTGHQAGLNTQKYILGVPGEHRKTRGASGRVEAFVRSEERKVPEFHEVDSLTLQQQPSVSCIGCQAELNLHGGTESSNNMKFLKTAKTR